MDALGSGDAGIALAAMPASLVSKTSKSPFAGDAGCWHRRGSQTISVQLHSVRTYGRKDGRCATINSGTTLSPTYSHLHLIYAYLLLTLHTVYTLLLPLVKT
jgi:hypothetical protein